eukprot:GHVS01063456.1.p1 GENE.GHVS01063456.1~~GHVS01063456.1.p1  ORF type:complete len:477 (+),score=56.92 GHVS01063456.1:53-1483(+)
MAADTGLMKLPVTETKLSFKPHLQYYKTKLCPTLQSGGCARGNSCIFAHSEEELLPTPNLHKTRLCRYAQAGVPCEIPQCSFAHRKEELRHTSCFFKTNICHMWKKGRCGAGDGCRHAHGMTELREHRLPSRRASRANQQHTSVDTMTYPAASASPLASSEASWPQLSASSPSFISLDQSSEVSYTCSWPRLTEVTASTLASPESSGSLLISPEHDAAIPSAVVAVEPPTTSGASANSSPAHFPYGDISALTVCWDSPAAPDAPSSQSSQPHASSASLFFPAVFLDHNSTSSTYPSRRCLSHTNTESAEASSSIVTALLQPQQINPTQNGTLQISAPPSAACSPEPFAASQPLTSHSVYPARSYHTVSLRSVTPPDSSGNPSCSHPPSTQPPPSFPSSPCNRSLPYICHHRNGISLAPVSDTRTFASKYRQDTTETTGSADSSCVGYGTHTLPSFEFSLAPIVARRIGGVCSSLES